MTMPEQRSHLQPRASLGRLAASSRGVVLVIVLLLSAVITLTVLAFSLGVGTDLRISRNDLLGKQALAAAEAGVQHGMEALQKLATATEASGDIEAVPSFLDPELALSPTGALAQRGTITAISEAGEDGVLRSYNYSCITYGDGRYCLRLIDNHDEIAAGFPLRCVTPQASPSPYAAQQDYQAYDCDLAVTLRARGEVGGAVRIVDVLLNFSTAPDCAITANGNVTLSGNASVLGSKGCVHSNGSLKLKGAMLAIGQATASGAVSVQNNSVEVGGITLSSAALQASYEAGASQQPLLQVPSVRPMLFGAQVIPLPTHVMNDPNGYRLDADGNIYVGPGFTGPGGAGGAWTCPDPSGSSDCSGGRALSPAEKTTLKLTGWSFSGGNWSTGAGSPVNGLYFIETPVTIGSNWGKSNCATDPCPWRATLIALNSIRVTGNPVMSSYYQSSVPGGPGYVTPASPVGSWELRNLLLISGNDLELKGTGSSVEYAGGLFAHQQVGFTGTPYIKGFLYAENGATTWPGDPAPNCNSALDLQGCGAVAGEQSISGNYTIEYDGLGTAAVAPLVRKLSWSDVR